jgi:hypothetical protein
LTGLFEEETPLENTELAVCWEYGDLAELREYERNGYFGGEVNLHLEQGGIQYENSQNTFIEVIEVKPLMDSNPKTVANNQAAPPDMTD